MMKDKFFKTMLVIIAALLLLNLFGQQISSFLAPETMAQNKGQNPQPLVDTVYKTQAFSIACSDDGRHVYALCGFSDNQTRIYRSSDYGKSGSWELVARGPSNP